LIYIIVLHLSGGSILSPLAVTPHLEIFRDLRGHVEINAWTEIIHIMIRILELYSGRSDNLRENNIIRSNLNKYNQKTFYVWW